MSGTNDEWPVPEGSVAHLPFAAFAELIIGSREEQQDAVRIGPLPNSNGALLLVVVDGMGGHVGGGIASTLAIERFIEAMAVAGEIDARLAYALDCANSAIGDAIVQRPELRGMGCTLVGAVMVGREVQWISVGDTILAEIAHGRFHRLNADHSFAPLLEAQVVRGEITVEEAQASDQRHILRSALTGGRIALIDEGRCGLASGGLLIAASDGIHTLQANRLGEIALTFADPQQFVLAALDDISHSMPDDQDNTTLAAALVPGKVTRPVDELLGPQRQDRKSGVIPFVVITTALLIMVATAFILFRQ